MHIHIYIYVCIYVCIYIYICTYIHICIHTHKTINFIYFQSSYLTVSYHFVFTEALGRLVPQHIQLVFFAQLFFVDIRK